MSQTLEVGKSQTKSQTLRLSDFLACARAYVCLCETRGEAAPKCALRSPCQTWKNVAVKLHKIRLSEASPCFSEKLTKLSEGFQILVRNSLSFDEGSLRLAKFGGQTTASS